MNTWQAVLIALIGGVPAIITALATLLSVVPDAKKRRKATNSEHAAELKEIRALKTQVNKLNKALLEFMAQAAENAQTKIDGA